MTMIDGTFNKRRSLKQDSNENVAAPRLRRQTAVNRRTTLSIFDQKQAARVDQNGRVRVTQPTREEIEAKIEASEAKTETKFVELRSDIRSIASQISAIASDLSTLKNDNKSTRTTVITTGIALFGALIGVAAIAATFWYNGTVVFDHLHPHG